MGGRGYVLDPASPLSQAEWIVIGGAQGQAKAARITAAARLESAAIDNHLHHLVERRSTIRWNAREERVEARLERRMGAITIARGPDPMPDAAAMRTVLYDTALERLEGLLPAALMARARFAHIAALSPDRLRDTAELWLAPLLEGRRDLDLSQARIADALLAQIDWNARQQLDTSAPTHFESPAGTRAAIDYEGEGAPSIAIRVQALFGLDRHPMVGDTPLLLQLTSPAGRPIQATRDLPGFWRGSWRDVAREMKGRYPKHRWPDEPWREKPSLKTKNAYSRDA